MNDTEIYETGVFTSTEVIQVPLSLYFGEFTCLLLAVAFGLALYVRKRQPCALLLPLAALLFAVPMLPWLLSELPALQSSQWTMRVVQVLSHQTWLRPVGALLLAIYGFMQWRTSSRKS